MAQSTAQFTGQFPAQFTTLLLSGELRQRWLSSEFEGVAVVPWLDGVVVPREVA